MPNDRKRRAADYVVRTRDLSAAQAARFRHPLNPKSDIQMQLLSDRVGMQRAQLSLARIPSGKESFIPHAHRCQEEFIFILEGKARLEIDGEALDVGAGDYVGFPTDGAVHHLINDGPEDLVYLMGGERTAVEVASFPTLGKTGIWADGSMRYIDAEAGQAFTIQDFVKPPEPETR